MTGSPDDGWQRQDQGQGHQGGPPQQGSGYTHDPYAQPQRQQGGYPPQQYGHQQQQPPYGQAPQSSEARTNVFAVISLVASILGIIGVLAFLGSVIGIVLAVMARKEIQADPTQQGKGLADWGMILGVVGLVFWFFMAILMVFMAALFGGFWWTGPWWDW